MSSPKKRFVCGGVSASVWEDERESSGGTFLAKSVTFSRRYKRSDGEWDSTSSFKKNDLPRLEVVCRRAYEFLNERDGKKDTRDVGQDKEDLRV
ncbi:MAG: hypothetical protein JRH07_19475 [Deltaproteobacteria bacterium]|nr:hypothetical protein [Deltaproteobacteria bacterium]